jgi:hypothetical protein
MAKDIRKKMRSDRPDMFANRSNIKSYGPTHYLRRTTVFSAAEMIRGTRACRHDDQQSGMPKNPCHLTNSWWRVRDTLEPQGAQNQVHLLASIGQVRDVAEGESRVNA